MLQDQEVGDVRSGPGLNRKGFIKGNAANVRWYSPCRVGGRSLSGSRGVVCKGKPWLRVEFHHGYSAPQINGDFFNCGCTRRNTGFGDPVHRTT